MKLIGNGKSAWDVRSLVVGALIGGALLGVYGAGRASSAAPSAGAGRFTIATNEGHAFVLDTQTGQVWEKFEPASSGNNDSDFSAVKVK